MRMLLIDSLVKKYGDLVVVNEISFNVKKGEIFAGSRIHNSRNSSHKLERKITLHKEQELIVN